MKTIIDSEQFGRTLKRMTHEIIERNEDLSKIVLVGIERKGTPIAKEIKRLIKVFEDEDITFDTIQNDDTINDSYKSLLLYYGKLTDSGVDGAVIYATALNSRDMFFTGKGEFFSKELLVTYGCYDIKNEFDLRELYIPVNFDKLTAPTKSEPEYYPLENGKNLTVTYYPCKSTRAATPDSAD